MADVSAVTAQPELKRAIGPKLLLFFVIGDILGTGIYALTGSVAGVIGGALWIPFLLAFVVAFLTAFSYLELVGKYPRAAGAALYTHKAFGINFLTFMVTFTVMASGVTSAATAAKAFGDTYLRQFIELPTWAVAGVFILGLALINFRGVGESVKVNVVLTCIELSGLLLIIGVGLYAVATGTGEPSRLVEIDTGDSSAFLAITAATSLAFFAMVGFEDSVNMARSATTRRGSSRARCCWAWGWQRRSTWWSPCCRRCSCPRRSWPMPRATRCSGYCRPAHRVSRCPCSPRSGCSRW